MKTWSKYTSYDTTLTFCPGRPGGPYKAENDKFEGTDQNQRHYLLRLKVFFL